MLNKKYRCYKGLSYVWFCAIYLVIFCFVSIRLFPKSSVYLHLLSHGTGNNGSLKHITLLTFPTFMSSTNSFLSIKKNTFSQVFTVLPTLSAKNELYWITNQNNDDVICIFYQLMYFPIQWKPFSWYDVKQLIDMQDGRD